MGPVVTVRKVLGLCLVAGLLVSCAGAPGRDRAEEGGRDRAGVKAGKVAGQGRGGARGEELAAEAFRLFREADSVRMTRTDAGRKASLLMDREGNCTGTYDGGPMRRAEVVVVAGRQGAGAVYIRYTERALAEILEEAERRGPATEAEVGPKVELIRGKFLKMPDPQGKFGTQCSLETGARTLPRETEGVQAGEPTVRGGVKVVPLTDAADDETTLYVAAEGPAYLRFVVLGTGGEIRFSDYGARVSAKAPPAHLVVEADDMAGGLLDA
ncbi:hypothetical protein [Streptomyces indicus]|uniref:Lipoprotein n=1 Tax=Streptomyces indicus TaxID=417292 RepID=A0A1G9EJK5_9ACTN|nr:hypothetical protein [Streptomyces indicus]SDK76263.1 hypothetical protein SAMN05421806_111210 [Streptomyces indicus]